MNRAMGPLMLTSMVIYRLQQMNHVLTEVQELAEWVLVAEEVIHKELSRVNALPDPIVSGNQE